MPPIKSKPSTTITIFSARSRIMESPAYLVASLGHSRCESQLLQNLVGVEKVTEISRMRFSRSMLEGSDPAHALLDSDRRRTADHDGATRPLRSAVLLLPAGRSGS